MSSLDPHAAHRPWLERLHELGALHEEQARGELGRLALARLVSAGLVERLAVGEGIRLVWPTRRGRRLLGVRAVPRSVFTLERLASLSLAVWRHEGEGWALLERGPWSALLKREGKGRLLVWSREGRPERSRATHGFENGVEIVSVP